MVHRLNLLFAVSQPLAAESRKGPTHKFPRWRLAFPTPPQNLKTCPGQTSSSFLLTAEVWSAWPVFWWYPHPAWVTDYAGVWQQAFSIKFAVSRLSVLFFIFFLMGTNCSWQHRGWSNISPNVKGLTANEVWPYQEPGPIHLKADLLSPCATTLAASSVSLAAVFHHWIALRRCQNSRPCVQCFFFFSSLFVSLDTVGMALSFLDNEWVSIWLFVYPSVTQISSTPCSLQFDKLRRECGRRLWLMRFQCWSAHKEVIVGSKLVVIIIRRRMTVKMWLWTNKRIPETSRLHKQLPRKY